MCSDFLYSLARDNELHSGVGEDCGNMTLAALRVAFGDDSWRYFGDTRNSFKYRNNCLGSFGKSGVGTSADVHSMPSVTKKLWFCFHNQPSQLNLFQKNEILDCNG